MELDFPRGPWKEIFQGDWTGNKIFLFKNPDLYTITVVEDREEGELQGLVLFLNKYYVVAGNLSKLNTELGGYSTLMEKNMPTKKGRFFTISTGPEYVEPETEEIDSKIEEMFYSLKEKDKKLYELSKAHEVDLTELKHSGEESILFNRPNLINGLLHPQRKEERDIKTTGQKILIGKKLDGRKAEEDINNFQSSILIGREEQLERAIHVLLENCVLSGVNGIIFDDSERYTNLSSPNMEFPHHEYPDLQPIGMPVRNLEPGEVQVNLRHLDSKGFREIINVPKKEKTEGEYVGDTTARIVDRIINEKEPRSLKDIEKELLSTEGRAEVEKFHRYRGIRWMKVMNQVYPDFIDGETDLKSLVSAYLQSMGSIIRIDTSVLPPEMKRAFAYSFTRTLYEENKQEGFTQRMRAMVIMPKGEIHAPKEPTERIQENTLEVLTDANAYGIGYVLGTRDKLDIYKPLIKKASMVQKFTGKKQVAIQPKERKPYRVNLRPYLTS